MTLGASGRPLFWRTKACIRDHVVPALSLTNLSFRQGRDWVLSRLTVTVPAGATVLLTGANGVGKTTLLRLFATTLRPTRGALCLFGRPAWPQPAPLRRRLGLLTHQHHLYEGLSAEENLRFIAEVAEASGSGAPVLTGPSGASRRQSLLEEVGLAPEDVRPMRDFSAGMKRRLALARLLLLSPELALLDEPYGQLDPRGVTLVNDVIARHQRAGNTLVMATHDVERGLSVATHRLHLTGANRLAQLVEL